MDIDKLTNTFRSGEAYQELRPMDSKTYDRFYAKLDQALAHTNYCNQTIAQTYLRSMFSVDTIRFDRFITSNTNRLKWYDLVLYNDHERTDAAHNYTLEHLNSTSYTKAERGHLVAKSIYLGTRTNSSALFFLNSEIIDFVDFLYLNAENIAKEDLVSSMLLYSYQNCIHFSDQSKTNIEYLNLKLESRLKNIAVYLYFSDADKIIKTANALGINQDLSYWTSALSVNDVNPETSNIEFV